MGIVYVALYVNDDLIIRSPESISEVVEQL